MTPRLDAQGPASSDYVANAVEERMRRYKVDKYLRREWTHEERQRFQPFETEKGEPDHPLPYLVLEVGDPTGTGFSSGSGVDGGVNEDIQEGALLVNLKTYGRDRDEAKAAKEEVIKAFEASKLVVTKGLAIVTINRTGDTLRPDGDEEWFGTVTYSITYEMTFNNQFRMKR